MTQETEQLRQVKLKLKKRDSAMLYFTLESNENLSFYSTLPGEKESEFREIIIHCHPSLSKQLTSLINHFKSKYPVDILSDNDL